MQKGKLKQWCEATLCVCDAAKISNDHKKPTDAFANELHSKDTFIIVFGILSLSVGLDQKLTGALI